MTSTEQSKAAVPHKKTIEEQMQQLMRVVAKLATMEAKMADRQYADETQKQEAADTTHVTSIKH